MKKEIYVEIITHARKKDLDGIFRVAVFDPDIVPSELSKLYDLIGTIKENVRK